MATNVAPRRESEQLLKTELLYLFFNELSKNTREDLLKEKPSREFLALISLRLTLCYVLKFYLHYTRFKFLVNTKQNPIASGRNRTRNRPLTKRLLYH